MATTKDPNSGNQSAWQNQKKEHDDDDDQTAVSLVTILSRPKLPIDIIHQIIPLLPTKSVVRMSTLSKQFENVWYTQPELDLDEGNPPDDTTDNNIQHTKFINFLERYLDYFHDDDKVKQHLLDKLRLRMTTFAVGDSTILDELLSLAVRRSLNELDISIGGNEHAALYCITPKNPLYTAKSITTLRLEHVTVDAKECKSISLPSLKTMSLKSLRFSLTLISRCPSMEYLSLSSCSMGDDLPPFMVSNANLKSLEVTYCDFDTVKVESILLESFTFVSECYVRLISLWKCRNLKSISILAEKLEYLYINSCGHSMKTRISSASLKYIQFTGFSKYKLSIEAQNLKKARITIRREEQTFDVPWEQLSSLRDFLESFASCSQEIFLTVDHVETLIFPENFRKTFSPPLPILKHFKVALSSPILARNSDLMDSLTWTAPSAKIN